MKIFSLNSVSENWCLMSYKRRKVLCVNGAYTHPLLPPPFGITSCVTRTTWFPFQSGMCSQNELAFSCERQLHGDEAEIRLTHVARSTPTNPTETGTIARVKFSQKKKTKTISPETIQSQQFSKLNDVYAGMCGCTRAQRQSKRFTAEPCVCVWERVRSVHANDYADTVCRHARSLRWYGKMRCKRTLSKNHLCKNFNNFCRSEHTHTQHPSPQYSKQSQKRARGREKEKSWIFHWHVNRTNWNCTLKILIQN